MKRSTNLLISHAIADELPTEKHVMRKLLFFTTPENENRDKKFYMGTGKNSFDPEEIERKVTAGELIKLPKYIPLEDLRGLWTNSAGEIIYADLKSPNKDLGGRVVGSFHSVVK